MKNIKTARFAIHCFLMLALFPLVSIAQEELPPVENVRVENGAIVWDPLIIESGDQITIYNIYNVCLLYTSPSPRDATLSRMPSSA